MQAMPLRRSTAAVLAALALSAALVAGCSKSSSNQQSGAPLPDAATLLKQSTQTTRDLKSAHLELTVQGKIQGLPLQSLTGDLTNTPAVAAKGHTRLMQGGDAAEAEFVVLDGTLYGSLDPNSWNNFGAASNIYDVSVILNPDAGLANILSNFTNPKADGRETINGVQTIKTTGRAVPTPSTRSPRRSPRAEPSPAPPGSVRTATTTSFRSSWNPAPATAFR